MALGRQAVTKRTRGRKWMAIREQALLKTQYRCAECLRNDKLSIARQVDHIIPLHKGGTDDLDNLEGLCLTCHERKTARDMGHKVKVTFGADGWPE
ncbi:MAG TPA: HNH endonuclease [Erythrobacter sp.]|nr:HNH endonuclease [Erythrobacter sp.]